MEQDLLEAKNYLSQQGYGRGTNYSTNLVVILLANYAQEKVKKLQQHVVSRTEVKQTKNSYGDVTGYVCESTGGLTKREYCALTLMQALISNADRHSQEGDCQTWNYEHLSKIAISAADHLLNELSEAEKKN